MWWINRSCGACIITVCAVFTLVAAVKDAWESVGAFEVEKGGDGEDQNQADQQCSQKKRGRHTWPSCSETWHGARNG